MGMLERGRGPDCTKISMPNLAKFQRSIVGTCQRNSVPLQRQGSIPLPPDHSRLAPKTTQRLDQREHTTIPTGSYFYPISPSSFLYARCSRPENDGDDGRVEVEDWRTRHVLVWSRLGIRVH